MKGLNPLTFAVIRHRFLSIAEEMLNIAMHCGVTTQMYEIRDCSFGILDGKCRLIAQSDGIPLFGGTLGTATLNCVEYIGRENIHPGDVIICNIPELVGNHLSDVLLFTPIYYEGRLWGFATSKAHWIDVGAKSVYPTDAKNRYEEGIQIPPEKIYRSGRHNKDVWRFIAHNTRASHFIWGDMHAQIAACRYAEKHCADMLRKYGVETVNLAIERIFDHSEEVLRSALKQFPDGSWVGEDYLDNNGIDLQKPLPIRVTVTKVRDEITLDFSGSSEQQQSPMNSTWLATCAATYMAIKCLFAPQLPINDGFTRPVRIFSPKGTIFNPEEGLPCYLCGDVASSILELINKALCEVLPDVPACSGGHVVGSGFFGADSSKGRFWATIVPVMIGQGADRESDGDNYLMHHAAGGGKNIPVEILEKDFPLFVKYLEFVSDSGGAGRQRGGLASCIDIKVLKPSNFFVFIEKCSSPHWGVKGGKPGLRNYAIVRRKRGGEEEVCKNPALLLDEEDEVLVIAGGGGGYGHPYQRAPEKVLEDVKNGYVSLEGARKDYGVVVTVDEENFKIDYDSTLHLRGCLEETKTPTGV